ncbi:hypothetical protein XENORESO_020148 [Xenotaenia resolanae]|uniref:Uncharacterized protein n=1 Tax=Xenotaenia resolanae TaxID=208358 RepID=A0ABV0X590_9TELE
MCICFSRSLDQEYPTGDETQLESDLQVIERHYGIKQRWCQSDEVFQSTLRDLDQEVRGHLILQAQNEARERVTLLNLKRKYPDGQGIAIRLSKQVNACNRRLKKIITGYNGLQWPPQTTKFPSHLEFPDVRDVSLPLYSFIDEPTGDKSGVPRALKRRAIDALHLKTRAAEEKLLLQREMDTLIHHLHQQHEHLHSAINDTTDPGSKAVLLHSIILLERKLYNAMIMFTNHITVVAPPPNVYLPEFTSVSQSVISADLHILLCDDSSHDKEDEADENDVDDDDDDEVDDCN